MERYYFQLSFFETHPTSLTYPTLEFVESCGSLGEDLFKNDSIIFVDSNSLGNFQNGKFVFQLNLLKHLSKNTKRSYSNIRKNLLDKMVLIAMSTETTKNHFFLDIFIKNLKYSEIRKIYLLNQNFNSIRNNLSINKQIYFRNCKIEHFESYIESIENNLHFENSKIGYFKHSNASDNQTLRLKNCSINYLDTTAQNIFLENISGLSLFLFKAKNISNLTIVNVSIKFSKETILKYLYFDSSLNRISDKKPKGYNIFEKFLYFYFKKPEQYIPGEVLFPYPTENKISYKRIINKFKNNISYFKPKIYVEEIGDGIYTYKEDPRIEKSSIGFAYNQSVLIKSLNEISSTLKDYKVKESLINYHHYFSSRNNYWRQLLYFLHAGYRRFKRPLLLLIISIILNTFLINLIRNDFSDGLHSIYFNFNIISYFEKILFKNLEFNFNFLLKLSSLMLESLNFYLIFCLTIYIKELISFPKKYE
ncbi:hypothetical protein [Leptospira vanthielii]|uniref:Uncharacterized protein n=1 Tax=Leptospira vanthielii serovar Holland str. Waz Holland = ATCC 700522 TaxID=1218591 RepID=N1W308_9LEPT|nr:hypothetical protein [Leptospira vanthielii]EMY70604.1 hypothetical protein LEP1GSC199_1623 [Leptospira vanthielii serovar Holland str. Waz Holland = ATCC 700522]